MKLKQILPDNNGAFHLDSSNEKDKDLYQALLFLSGDTENSIYSAFFDCIPLVRGFKTRSRRIDLTIDIITRLNKKGLEICWKKPS